MKNKIIIIILVFIVVIQFIKPEKNQSLKTQVNNIERKFNIPSNTATILKSTCYDCHSNNTSYPWYANIQPVAWWLDHHIDDGKKHLNFDEFLTYSLKKQDHKLEELIESQTDQWMPLESYTLIHKDAHLTDEQRKSLITWAEGIRNKIQAEPDFASSSK